jgi:transposase-like protein
MSSHLSNPIFHDENAAREWFEARIWPDGPFCAHCGSTVVTRLHGKAHRPGLFQCNDCREQFTVTVNTVCERSKIPLSKWCTAVYLINSSKKGMSALQMHRMMGGSYKTAWFMMHRIREAMRESKLGPLGGEGKFVEPTRPSPAARPRIACIKHLRRKSRSLHSSSAAGRSVVSTFRKSLPQR